MNKLSTLLNAIENHLNTYSDKTDNKLFTLFIAKHLPVALHNLQALTQEILDDEREGDIKEDMLLVIFEAEKAIKQWMDEHGDVITDVLDKKQ